MSNNPHDKIRSKIKHDAKVYALKLEQEKYKKLLNSSHSTMVNCWYQTCYDRAVQKLKELELEELLTRGS